MVLSAPNMDSHVVAHRQFSTRMTLLVMTVLISISFIKGEDVFLPGYEVIPTSTQGSIGALEKCGEGSQQGVKICVPYHMCNGATGLVDRSGVTDGFGVIDIRQSFGADECQDLLDVCCTIPKDDNASSSETPPITQGPITTPTTSRPSDGTQYCGIRNPNGIDFKITGATHGEAEYGEFPWMVAILKKYYNPSVDKSLSICGGSLISLNVVLTGAHCVHKYKSGDLLIRAGEWDTQTTKERLPYQERDISDMIVHEKFNPQILFNDVALLILSRSLDTAENIGTICLPSPGTTVMSDSCYASGWGKTLFGKEGEFSVILKKIELPVVPHDQCQNLLRTTRLGTHFILDQSFTCAGGEEGKDTCTGDGGSPLVCPDPSNPSRYVQAGLVAWGIGCGEQKIPGVYADVGKFRDWIDENMRRLNFDTNSYSV